MRRASVDRGVGERRRAACVVRASFLVGVALSVLGVSAFAITPPRLLSIDVDGRRGADSPLPFSRPPLSVLRESQKKVFAHYFTPFPLSLDNRDPATDYYTRNYLNPDGENGKFKQGGGYLRERPLPRAPRAEADWEARDMEEEVRRASEIGLDGFAADLLSSPLSTSSTHWRRVQRLLDAAQRVDPGFKIMLMPDMNVEYSSHPERLTDAIRALAAHPSALRLPDGRLVVAPYNAHNQSATWWKDWLDAMRSGGIDIALVPLFQGWRNYATAFAPFSAGMSDWGPRWPSGAASIVRDPAAAHDTYRVPIWMAPVAPQDYRPKAVLEGPDRTPVYWEAGNSQTFRTLWQSAIDGGADWVQVITWNDYGEHSEISPSTGIQHAFYDLTAYYAAWFKTGTAPPITRDVLYYFYRVQPTTAVPSAPQTLARRRGVDGPRDEVELLAFLTAPGTLEVELGGQTRRMDAGAGVTSFRVPLANGQPVFRLVRSGRTEITTTPPWTISDQVVYQDLLYRAGSNTRVPIR